MKKYHLSLYVTGVIIVLAIINFIVWFTGKGMNIGIFSAGFLVGMLAMYIAVHFYRWK
jgi:hypothetical protein